MMNQMTDTMPTPDTRVDTALAAMRQPPALRRDIPSQVAARAVLANAPSARARTWSFRAAAAFTMLASGSAGLAVARLYSRADTAPAQDAVAVAFPGVAAGAAFTPVLATAARPIVFELDAPSARSVQVLGDFNQWSRSVTSMQRGADGRWRMTTLLPPGRYVYAFLVDGHTFRRDLLRDAVEDRDFGVTGSELVVGEAP
jgi:Glycogen recognition site of AMP-activated protein kinase